MEPEPEPEPGGSSGRVEGTPAVDDEVADSVKVIALGGTVGELRIDEPYWSDDPRARGAGTGASLWDGSVLLARQLQQLHAQGDPALRGRVLELGAGCSGVPSLAAARLGCFDEVWATDGGSEDVEDNLVDLRRNLDANGAAVTGAAAVQVRRLEWGAPRVAAQWVTQRGNGRPLDCILASEVVYLPECVPLLLSTLRDLSGPETIILMYISERHPQASADWWATMPEVFEHDRLGPPLVAEDSLELKAQQQGVFRLRKRTES
jgi:predicted nicotinamide N-methyase